MPTLSIYQVDAFTDRLFHGNPAAVVPLPAWLSDELMQAIAAENNLSETAFFVPEKDGFHIRWFTPNTEVALCGHATLAAAYVIFNHMNYRQDEIRFRSLSGELKVRRQGGLLQLDFPALSFAPANVAKDQCPALGAVPDEIYQSDFDLLCVFSDEQQVRAAKPDLSVLAQWPYRGIIFTAPSTTADCYSRCFYPACSVPEDPVTGSAHCVIVPYWAARLGKQLLRARQGLARQGELHCELHQNRVLMAGDCRLYLTGIINY